MGDAKGFWLAAALLLVLAGAVGAGVNELLRPPCPRLTWQDGAAAERQVSEQWQKTSAAWERAARDWQAAARRTDELWRETSAGWEGLARGCVEDWASGRRGGMPRSKPKEN